MEDTMRKGHGTNMTIAVSVIVGLFTFVSAVSPTYAFFSRDTWYHPNNNGLGNEGGPTQLLVNGSNGENGYNGSNGSNGYSGPNSSNGTNGNHGLPSNGDQSPSSVVPEPSTVLLLASGLLGMGLWLRRKQGKELGTNLRGLMSN